MVQVPTDDPHTLSWKRALIHVGLPESVPQPVRRRGSAGIGIGPVRSGQREVDPAPREKPPAYVMRSEATSMAQRIRPNLKKA
jgi:hypothetical protein